MPKHKPKRPPLATCAWCGASLPLTAKGRLRQHLNGGKQCHGNGFLAHQHAGLREAAKALRESADPFTP